MTIQMKHQTDTTGSSDNEESRIQKFIYQMLVTRVFAACFIGRFYVNHVKSYRDVLQIQNEEKEIIRDLHAVKKRVFDFYKGAVWSAITGPNLNETPSGHCVWIILNKRLPLGTPHWFLIENVAINVDGELIITVKYIRSVNKDVEHSSVSDTHNGIDWTQMKYDFTKVLQDLITWHNTKESVRFTFVLLMTVATVALNGLQYLGDFSIRFFREFNNFIHVSTPILLSIIDLVKKSIGGVLVLLAMMFGVNRQGPPPRELPQLQGPYRKRLNY